MYQFFKSDDKFCALEGFLLFFILTYIKAGNSIFKIKKKTIVSKRYRKKSRISYNLLKLLNNVKFGPRQNKGKSVFSKFFDNKIALTENNVSIRNK